MNLIKKGIAGMDDIFGTLLNPYMYEPYDLRKDDDGTYKMDIDVPGFNKDNLDVEVDYERKVITVSGKSERRTMNQRFAIPHLDMNDVVATIQDGILTLSFTSIEGEAVRKIEIK